MLDCGVGLGVFLLKRKITVRPDGTELLLNACDRWVTLRVAPNEKVQFSVHDSNSSNSGNMERAE